MDTSNGGMLSRGYKSLTVRVPVEVFERIEEKRYRDKVSVQDAGAQFFADWASGKEGSDIAAGLTLRQRDQLKSFVELLRARPADADLEALQENVLQGLALWIRFSKKVEK